MLNKRIGDRQAIVEMVLWWDPEKLFHLFPLRNFFGFAKGMQQPLLQQRGEECGGKGRNVFKVKGLIAERKVRSKYSRCHWAFSHFKHLIKAGRANIWPAFKSTGMCRDACPRDLNIPLGGSIIQPISKVVLTHCATVAQHNTLSKCMEWVCFAKISEICTIPAANPFPYLANF